MGVCKARAPVFKGEVIGPSGFLDLGERILVLT